MQLIGRRSELAILERFLASNHPEFLVLIAAHGVQNNYYADSFLSGIVTLDDFSANLLLVTFLKPHRVVRQLCQFQY